MVAQNTMRVYGVNQVFRFVEGIWLHRKIRKSISFLKSPILLHICATCSELPVYTSTMTIPRLECGLSLINGTIFKTLSEK